MQQLISALGSGNSVIFFGAGPSMEAGLPSWSSLAKMIADSASKLLADPLPIVYREISAKDFPKAIGELERIANSKGFSGRKIIIDSISNFTKDTGNTGDIYSLMGKLPTKLYLTTNFDSIFERHLRSAKIVPNIFNNTSESIDEIDPASYDKSIIHIHGSIDHGGEIIITDTDYNNVIVDDKFSALRQIISSYLSTSAVAIIGYSFTDPDLMIIARTVSSIIHRKHPIIAVIADATDKQANDFSREYNINVKNYSSGSNHSELKAMLSTIVKWLETPQAPVEKDTESMRAAQTLYVYNATEAAGDPAIIAAIKSLLLTILTSNKRALTLSELPELLRVSYGVKPNEAFLLKAIDECKQENNIISDGTLIQITDRGNEVVSVSNRKYKRLWSNLYDQAKLSISQDDSLDSVLQNVLISLFSNRAAEAVSLSMSNEPIETSSISLFDLIEKSALDIGNYAIRLKFIEYVIDMLRRPNAVQRAIIEHLGRSLFCVHALRLDANANKAFGSIFTDKAFLLDSNILIPLIAKDSPNHQSITSLLSSMKASGAKLYTTNGFLQELIIHANWALTFIYEHSDDQAAILDAARGFNQWDGNEFLSGWIILTNSSGIKLDINDYMHECFKSKNLNQTEVKNMIEQVLNIELISQSRFADCSKDYLTIFHETEKYIKGNAYAGKSATRIETEAEVYTIIHEWENYSCKAKCPHDTAILSSGGYLNSVALRGPFPLKKNITTTVFALGSYISTYLNSDAIHDFSAIVKSEFFNSASDYIEDKQLQTFFSSTINAADRAYTEQLRPMLEKIRNNLIPEDLPETLGEIAPIQRPGIVNSLSSFISKMIESDQITTLKKTLEEAKLSAENESIRATEESKKAKEEAEKARNASERAERAEALLIKRQRGEKRYKRLKKSKPC